jgi:hypothetical protein
MATSLTKEDWINQFLILSHWAEAKGYEVVLKTDGEDSVCFENKRILIDSRPWPESRFYTLLHECGHLLVYQNRKSFQKDHPMYAVFAVDGRKSNSAAYKVSLVSEELIAWKKGRGLARRLGLHIDKSRYDSTMVEAVMTYIDMAAIRT